jgi:hypothetical protein
MFLAAPVEPVTFFLAVGGSIEPAISRPAAPDSAAAAAGEFADKDSIFDVNGSLRLRIGRQTAVTCLTFRLPYIAVGGRLAARLDLGFILDANTVKGRVRRLQMFPLNN